jgi:hypothetical protein
MFGFVEGVWVGWGKVLTKLVGFVVEPGGISSQIPLFVCVFVAV